MEALLTSCSKAQGTNQTSSNNQFDRKTHSHDKVKDSSFKMKMTADSPLSTFNTGRAGIHITGTAFSNTIRTTRATSTNATGETQKQNRAQNKRTQEEMQNEDFTESSSFEGTPVLGTSTIDDSDHTAGTGRIGTNDSSTSSSGSSSKRAKIDDNEVDDAISRSDELFRQEDEVSIAQDQEGDNYFSSIHGPNTYEEYIEELLSFKAEHGHLPLTSTTPFSTSNKEKRTHEVEMESSSAAVSPEFDTSNTIHDTYRAAASVVTHNCAHSSSHDRDSLDTLNTFAERFQELASFKAQHGHCHPPQSSSSVNDNSSLGMWCANLRRSYTQKLNANACFKVPCLALSLDQIAKLETLGFVWDIERAFEDKFAELSAFKSMHGHCNPPRNPSTAYFSLGQWFYELRKSYAQIQQGKAPQWPLSQEQIRRLEHLGFRWKLSNRNAFEDRFAELALFKADYGHCSPPQTSATPYYSLAIWCNDKRRAYKQIQKGKRLHRTKMTQDQIVRLETLGFEWTRSSSATDKIFEGDDCQLKQRSFVNNCKSSKKSFEERIADLISFKDTYGHLYPPESETSTNKYCSLAKWCNDKRRAYKQIQQDKTPHSPLSQDQIRMLESLDFTWDSNASASIVRKLPATPDRFLQRAMAVINHRFASIAPSTAVPDGRYIDNFDEKEEAPLEVILPAISPDSMMNKSMRIFEWCPVCYVWNGSCCESRC